MRKANWVVPTCPQGMFLFPIKFSLFPSITHQNSFIFIKVSNYSYQIPLVPISIPSNSFVFIKFSNISYQIPLAPINNPSKSLCCHQVPIKFPSSFRCSHQLLLFTTQPYKKPYKTLTFGINFFCNLETWLLKWLPIEKDEKNVVKSIFKNAMHV
jgi:hypothetical protein